MEWFYKLGKTTAAQAIDATCVTNILEDIGPWEGGGNCFASFAPQNEREVSHAHQNYEWISTAVLLLVFQPHRTGCPISQNDSMAGHRLPQTSQLQSS
jgi:hypothetical protein